MFLCVLFLVVVTFETKVKAHAREHRHVAEHRTGCERSRCHVNLLLGVRLLQCSTVLQSL